MNNVAPSSSRGNFVPAPSRRFLDQHDAVALLIANGCKVGDAVDYVFGQMAAATKRSPGVLAMQPTVIPEMQALPLQPTVRAMKAAVRWRVCRLCQDKKFRKSTDGLGKSVVITCSCCCGR